MDAKTVADLNEELNSVTSDCSFVILGNGPPSTEVNNVENQNGSFHQMLTDSSVKSMKSMESALETLSHKSDRERPSDIQMQLDQLVKDNLLLKETLNQSNLAMKNQFATLSLWYDEVVKTHESHKEKFLESQEQISKLQLENANLKKMVEENLEMCIACNGNCDPVVVNVDGDEMNAMKKKLESTEETCKSLGKSNEELSLRNKELEKRLNDLIDEKLGLEKKIEELMKDIDQLKKDAETGKCNKCQSSLGTKSESEKGSSWMSSLDQDISVIKKLSKSIEEELGGTEMKDEIALLKRQLGEHHDIAQEQKFEMEKMKIQYDELLKDKEGLQNVLKTCKTLVEQLREQGRALNVQVKIKEDLLESKSQELEKAKKEMEKFVLDCEEVAILRAQMELYQNDFNEERNAREKAVGEKEQMAEEVRLLRRMMKDMMKKGNTKEDSASSETRTTEVKNPYVCSICSKRFGTSPEWESHVDECLTFHAFP